MNIMITFKRSGDFIYLSTYSRDAGKHGRFIIVRENLIEYWKNNKARFYDEDCGHLLKISSYNNENIFTIMWISLHSNNRITGIRQAFKLSNENMEKILNLNDNEEFKFLYNTDKSGKVKLDFSNAGKTIERILSNKLIRNAFRKAVRNQLIRGYDLNRTFYNDGKYDFFFRDNDGICGGLIYSEWRDRSGNEIRNFGIHT